MRLIDAYKPACKLDSVYCEECSSGGLARCRSCYMADAFGEIKDAPTVDAVPVVHARWIVKMDFLGRESTECSNCKTMIKYRFLNGSFELLDLRGIKYCQNCGAKMDLPDIYFGRKEDEK